MDISEIPLKFTFIPENPGEEEIGILNEVYDPEGINFLQLCRDLVWDHFVEAWSSLNAFFENTKIESISFVIDLTRDTNNLASVQIARSRSLRSVETQPVFKISRTLLEEYLMKYRVKDYEIDLYESTVIHHELVHILDKFKEEHFGLEDGQSRGKLMLLHLIQYRSEGIAELFYTLQSGTGLRDIDSARKMFEAELFRIFEISSKHPKNYRTMSSELPETGTFYDIGPWMVLHVLSCPGNPQRYENIGLILENLRQGIKMDEEIIFPLIGKALEISNFMFLKYLPEPGADGHPFIDKKELGLLINVIGQIGLKAKKEISFAGRDSQISDYYTNKIIKLYNRWGRINKSRKRKQ